MDNSIQQWLQQAKATGLSDEQITEKLLAQGYSRDSISELLNPSSSQINTEQLNIPKKSNKKTLIAIVVILLVIIVGVVSYFLFFNQETDTSASNLSSAISSESEPKSIEDTTTKCVPSDASYVNFEELIDDKEFGASCQDIYEKKLAFIDPSEEELFSYGRDISECINSALNDSNSATACFASHSDTYINLCIYGATATMLVPYCECDIVTNDDFIEECYKGTPVVMQKLTIEDFSKEAQIKPEPFSYKLYPESKYVETPSFDNDIYGTQRFQFSKLDPSECEVIIKNIYPDDLSSISASSLYIDCIQDLVYITADETMCNTIGYEPNRNSCISHVASQLASPIMCLSISRPDNLIDELDTHVSVSDEVPLPGGQFTKCMLETITNTILPTVDLRLELCELLGKTINNDQKLKEYCLSTMTVYENFINTTN